MAKENADSSDVTPKPITSDAGLRKVVGDALVAYDDAVDAAIGKELDAIDEPPMSEEEAEATAQKIIDGGEKK